jgi:hypothetical protein
MVSKPNSFVQVGLWNKKCHLLMRPIDILAKADKDGSYDVPRL